MLKRIALGFFAMAALVLGAWLVVGSVGSAHVPLPGDIDEWGLIPGPIAFGIWCGGKTYLKDFVQQLRLVGIGVVLSLVATLGIGYLVSLAAVEGAARMHLKIGVHGAVQVIVAVFLVWEVARSRWPVPETG